MQTIGLSVLTVTLLATGFARADESDEKQVINIAIAENDGSGGDPVYVELSGDNMDFNLKDMQVGESRSAVDTAGQNVLVTRTAEGYDFAVEGKNLSMPAFDDHAEHVEMVDFADADLEFEILDGNSQLPGADTTGVTVITATPLDAATRASILSALQSAGQSEEVTFIDRQSSRETHAGGVESAKRVKVIKKEIRVTQ